MERQGLNERTREPIIQLLTSNLSRLDYMKNIELATNQKLVPNTGGVFGRTIGLAKMPQDFGFDNARS